MTGRATPYRVRVLWYRLVWWLTDKLDKYADHLDSKRRGR